MTEGGGCNVECSAVMYWALQCREIHYSVIECSGVYTLGYRCAVQCCKGGGIGVRVKLPIKFFIDRRKMQQDDRVKVGQLCT